jgi:hypothetical protein
VRDTSAARAVIARLTKWSFVLFLVIGGLITVSALIDVLFGLGWGYHWRDVLVGGAILAWGFVVYGVCLLIFRFTDSVVGKR